jgi:hypothetical protein
LSLSFIFTQYFSLSSASAFLPTASKLAVFRDRRDAAEKWFEENDPEGQ